jgi:hypothetical protein
MFSLEGFLDGLLDCLEGIGNLEKGSHVGEFFGGEGNQGFDHDFVSSLGEVVDNLVE